PGRHATALLELALETNPLDSLHADLQAFETMLAASPELTRLVRSPVFGAGEQARALDAVLDRAGISGIARNFLRVVAANRRLFAVREIIKKKKAEVAKHKAQVTVEFRVPHPLKKKK